MINQQTVQKLQEMRLNAMADSFKQQLSDKEFYNLLFDERFGLIIDYEWSRRKNNALQRLIKNADFRMPNASIEDIEYHVDRNLSKEQILRLSTCNCIQEKRNLIITGASGNGKSYIACAFGIASCRNFYTTKYIRLPDLLDELVVARGEGIFKKVMKTYKKVSLLILDEWLLTPLKGQQALDLLEIVESRHQIGSTIFCSQSSPLGWHEKIGRRYAG